MAPSKRESDPSTPVRTTLQPNMADLANGPVMTSRPRECSPMPPLDLMGDMRRHRSLTGGVAKKYPLPNAIASSKRSNCSNNELIPRYPKQHRRHPSLRLEPTAIALSFIALQYVALWSSDLYLLSLNRGGLLHLLPLRKWT